MSERSTNEIAETNSNATDVDRAIAAMRAGEPVLVHDAVDREGETDLIYAAGAVTPDAVAQLRNDAGGLICVAVEFDVAETFDLPYVAEAIDHPATAAHDLGYDDRSSFSLTVNHRDTFTGITDRDRSATIRAINRASVSPSATDFSAQFRVPGHVPILKAAPDLVAQREGHTELGLALADMAELPPAVVVCEMLDDETGEAAAPAKANRYAERNDLVFLEGMEIIDSYRT